MQTSTTIEMIDVSAFIHCHFYTATVKNVYSVTVKSIYEKL